MTRWTDDQDSMKEAEMSTADAAESVPQAKRGGGAASKLLATAAVLALAGGVFTFSSLALFTGQDTITGNSFTSGTIDITATPATAVVSAGNMAPGDQVTAEMTIANSGTLELRYSMTSTTTEDVLAAELDLTIKTGVTTCDNTNWTADGSQIYTGILGSTGGSNVLGDPATGSQGGDRPLAAAANEVLCVNVTMPLSAGSTFEGLNSVATFTFDAEQTANNP